MPRLVALLRGINVGGHTVTMQDLCRPFTDLGFTNVETVIASGNVVFDTSSRPGPRLAAKIEDRLKQALGYEVATFVRTLPELRAATTAQPFNLGGEPHEAVVWVIFTRSAVAPALAEAMATLTTATDEARAVGREVYWLRRERGKASDDFGARLGKLLGRDTTSRNIRTIERIVAKYA